MEDLQLGYIPRWICLMYWGVYFLIFIFFFFQFQRKKRNYINNTFYAIAISLVLALFCFFYCLDTDFFNYMMVATAPEQYEGLGTVEEFYLWLGPALNGDYLLFRIVVWGLAVVMTYLACILFNTSRYVSIMLILIVFFNLFCYGRISLAMSVFWVGLAFLTKSNGKWLNTIGFVIIMSSLVLHRSTAIAIACLSIMFLPLNKKSELVISLLVIILGGGVAFLVLSGEVFSAGSDLAGRVNSYNTQIEGGQWGGLNIVGLFFRVAQYFLFYVIFLMIRNKMVKQKNVPSNIMALYKVTWVLTVAATAFLVGLGFTPYFYRVINMTLIPLCILMAYLFCLKLISNKQMKVILLLALVFHFLHFYSTYTHCV